MLVSLSLAVAASSLFSGCAIANVVAPPFQAAIYASPADAAGVTGAVALPSWVPADATNIRIKTDETKNATILTFSPGATPIQYTPCAAGSDPTVKQNTTAGLDETWWPQSVDPAGVVCTGAWHIFPLNGAWYGWTP
ncbi:hypothetical protein [Subtercola endophyticus]|uniref:hypothetical protein n=1 Tax=Subtercola endophyticus TaxID=2895559 RepID=UPI001E5A7351|nr:hypothetical protein [Subtercola endophyticus]UFS59400.1 hypothetical protein LQ955_00960 [Subtercola endophyticus]